MPSSWSEKDERQYEKIKQGAEQRGDSENRAKEIAARTVNKRRRKQGRTSNTTTRGTGDPHDWLEDRLKDELYNRARQLKIPGRSRMNKKELVDAIRRAN